MNQFITKIKEIFVQTPFPLDTISQRENNKNKSYEKYLFTNQTSL